MCVVVMCFVAMALWSCARKENADQAWMDDGEIVWWLVAAE
jgi:hypothetical protein